MPIPTEPSVTPSPDGTAVWQVVTGFPPLGATIVDVGLGFRELIAAGHIQAGTAECPHRTTAAMWESSDGLAWDQMLVDVVSNSAISVLAYPAFAIGRSGSPGCPGDGVAVWGPTDKADWYRDGAARFEPGDVVVDALFIEPDGRAVATGWAAGGGAGVWITKPSYFIGHWEPVESPPRGTGNPLVALAAAEQTVVGWDGTSTAPAWFSADGGNKWSNAEFEAPYWFVATDAIYAEGRFLAAGSVCCTVPNVRVGAVLSSMDGRSWSASGVEVLRAVPQAIVASDFGLVAIGAETYLSTDGSKWTVGPPLPGYLHHGQERLFAAVHGDTIIVSSPTRAWVASAAALKPEDWPIDASSPQPAEVGVSFPYHLVTHCGPGASTIHFDLRTWVPDEASLPNGAWPRSFDKSEEWGQIALAGRNVLEFTGTRAAPAPGAVVRFVPTDNPPESFSCS